MIAGIKPSRLLILLLPFGTILFFLSWWWDKYINKIDPASRFGIQKDKAL